MSFARSLLVALLVAGITFSGCSDSGSAKPPTSTPAPSTPSPKPAATVSPSWPQTYPPDTRTGRPDIDPVLAAIEIGTPDALRGIVGYVSVPCVAQRPPGLGPVSVCPAGVTPGTPLDMFPASPGEGTYAPRKDFEASPRLPGVGQQLLAITRQTRPTTDPGWPQGDYVLYFWGGPGVFQELFVAKGKAVLACWACGNPPVDLKDPALEFILPLIIPPP